jgi:hypothetical protein
VVREQTEDGEYRKNSELAAQCESVDRNSNSMPMRHGFFGVPLFELATFIGLNYYDFTESPSTLISLLRRYESRLVRFGLDDNSGAMVQTNVSLLRKNQKAC